MTTQTMNDPPQGGGGADYEEPLDSGIPQVLGVFGAVAAFFGLLWGLQTLFSGLEGNPIWTTISATLAAIVVTIGLFVGLNLIADLARKTWVLFGPLMGAAVGALALLFGWVLSGFFRTGWLGTPPPELLPIELRNFEFVFPLQELLIATAIGAVLGLILVLVWRPDLVRREQLSDGLRPAIFLTPALLFVGMSLVLPLLRTLYISFRDNAGIGSPTGESFGLSNYSDVFSGDIFDLSNIGSMFTSGFFWVAIALGVLAWYLGKRKGAEIGSSFEQGPGVWIPAFFAILLGAFALFLAVRGTIANNLWWVITVVMISGALGLMVAVLADRASGESLAKSLIFMPMALSFVGAGIIWRFMYIARPGEQTGVFNYLWVGLGRASNGEAPVTRIVLLLITLAIAGFLAWLGVRALSGGSAGGMWTNFTAAALVLGFAVLLFTGVGGWADGAPDPYLFLEGKSQAGSNAGDQTNPLNNFWLMVVMIWMQTGFTMVIFSSAIKGVPAELMEAASVDGATESEQFWSITIPQIAPTIGVVVTTLTVNVLKVFDIVKVMTGGNFNTQVLANEMFTQSFTAANYGLGSALAIVLFVLVLPIMYINIRRMQEERA